VAAGQTQEIYQVLRRIYLYACGYDQGRLIAPKAKPIRSKGEADRSKGEADRSTTSQSGNGAAGQTQEIYQAAQEEFTSTLADTTKQADRFMSGATICGSVVERSASFRTISLLGRIRKRRGKFSLSRLIDFLRLAGAPVARLASVVERSASPFER